MSLNSVVLTGRPGKDPEVKFTPAGKKVANLSLAVDYGYGDKKKTSWIDLVAWEKVAETFEKFVHKGSLIGIQGYLQQRSWQNDAGERRSKVEVVVMSLQLLEPKRDDAPAPARPVSGQPTRPQAAPEPEIGDEDIPF